MRKVINISIPEPCHEDWNKMTPVEKGRFCNACNKTVFDFTGKSDEQIIETFESRGNLCGRFKVTQLDRQLVLERKSKNSFKTLLASGIFSVLTFGYYHEAKAQNKPKVVQTDSISNVTLKGKQAVSVLKEKIVNGFVVDESGMPLPGANILIKGTNRGTQTDFDGLFTIKAEKGQTLVFSYLGFVTKEIAVKDSIEKNTKVKMVMKEDIQGEVVVVVGGAYSSSFCETSYTPTAEELEQQRKNKLRRKNYFTFYKRKAKEERKTRKRTRDSIRNLKNDNYTVELVNTSASYDVLSINEDEFQKPSISYSKSTKELLIKTNMAINLSEVSLYDTLGRKLIFLQNINSSTVKIPLSNSEMSTPLIVNVLTKDGKQLNRKILVKDRLP